MVFFSLRMIRLLSWVSVPFVFLFSSFAQAEAPRQNTQVPGYYRMAFGSFEITALYDGAIQLDTKLLKNITAKDIQTLIARMFLKGPSIQTAVNAYLINTGNQLVLVDAGAAKLFGPTLGNIVLNLKAAGYMPEQVDMVLVTHLHGDHVNGLVDGEGKAVFGNAEIWSAKADNDFWLSEAVAAQMPKDIQPLFKMARDAARPYIGAGRWKVFSADQEILPGISSFAANGHTPGHSAFLIKQGTDRLLIWGDIVHNHAVQFVRPEVAMDFDSDKKAAVETRKRIFSLAAKEKMLIGGMHLPFPGIGHIRKEKAGYSWVPIEFSPMPQ